MLMKLVSWLKSYLLISVRGDFPERFINLCTMRGIYLWDAVKKDGEILVKTSRKGFKKMTVPAKRASCRVKIIKKSGLSFLLKKHGRRKVFIGGFLVFVLITAVLNSFVWVVRVEGNQNISTEEIKIIASSCGLQSGVVKYKLDKRKISQNVLKAEPRLSWAWPELRGVVVYLHVREKEEGPKPINVKKQSNIIASRDGFIKELTVKRGWPLVAEGQSVVLGQVLISGHKEGIDPVHAEGVATAVWWSEVKKTVLKKQKVREQTGESKSYLSLILGDFGMSFRFSGKAPYEDFDIENEEKHFKLWKDLYLPIKLKKTTYFEAEESLLEEDLDKACSDASKELEAEFRENLPEGVKINSVTEKITPIDEEQREVSLIIELEGDIGLTEYTNTEEELW